MAAHTWRLAQGHDDTACCCDRQAASARSQASVDMRCCTHAGDHRYCSEPIFIPRAGASDPDDGYVCTMVHDVSSTSAAGVQVFWEILDGKDVAAGPVATIRLRDFVPPGLHGSWSERYAAPQPGERLPWEHDIRNGV